MEKKQENGSPQQNSGSMLAQVQASVEILSPIPVNGKCGEKDFHDRIMRITRVIGHDRLSLSAYIDHVLAHHFKQCEDAIKSLYAQNYNSVF